MFKAEVIKVIRTELEKKGKGTEDDPVRRLIQYWTLNGELLWEKDPCMSKNKMPNFNEVMNNPKLKI